MTTKGNKLNFATTLMEIPEEEPDEFDLTLLAEIDSEMDDGLYSLDDVRAAKERVEKIAK